MWILHWSETKSAVVQVVAREIVLYFNPDWLHGFVCAWICKPWGNRWKFFGKTAFCYNQCFAKQKFHNSESVCNYHGTSVREDVSNCFDKKVCDDSTIASTGPNSVVLQFNFATNFAAQTNKSTPAGVFQQVIIPSKIDIPYSIEGDCLKGDHTAASERTAIVIFHVKVTV